MPSKSHGSCFWCFALLAAVLRTMIPDQVLAEDEKPPNVAKFGRQLPNGELLKTLELISVQGRTNYEQVQTWKGSYALTKGIRFAGEIPGLEFNEMAAEEQERLPRLNDGRIPTGAAAGDGYWQMKSGVADFSLDRIHDKYHVFFHPEAPLGFIDVETGVEHRWKTNGDSVHWILTSEHSLEFDIHHGAGQLRDFPPVKSVMPGGGRIVYRRSPDDNLPLGNAFDARRFFHQGGSEYWKLCDKYAAVLRGERGERRRQEVMNTMKMYVNGALPPAYTQVAQHQGGLELIIIYDGNVGFNVVLSEQRINGQLFERRVVTYRNVDGIFIPESSLSQSFQHKPNNSLSMLTECRLESCEINETIPDSEFTLDQFDLAYGERMLDEIANRLFVFDKDARFVPASEFVYDPARAEKREQKGKQ
jgi:hypothetical protein